MVSLSLTLTAATAMTAIELLAAHTHLSKGFEFRNPSILCKHHGEEFLFILVSEGNGNLVVHSSYEV